MVDLNNSDNFAVRIYKRALEALLPPDENTMRGRRNAIDAGSRKLVGDTVTDGLEAALHAPADLSRYVAESVAADFRRSFTIEPANGEAAGGAGGACQAQKEPRQR